MKFMKRITKLLSHRMVIVILLILVQFGAIMAVLSRFNEYYVYFYSILDVIALSMTIYIVSAKSNPSYKIAWIVTIMTVPIFGILLYMIFGGNRISRREKKKMLDIYNDTEDYFEQDLKSLVHLESNSYNAYTQATYIRDYALCPVHENTKADYFKLGEEFFEDFVKELKKAKKFIFLEFFIIEEGKMWNTILDILEEKAQWGVDVRLIYDDMGCMFTLPKDYEKMLRKKGIKCSVFNPFVPILTSRFNNRDHRKIAVIDGRIAYTGGVNLADEYINHIEKYGHWKDNAIKLRGNAVWNFTVMFLSIWNYINNTKEDYTKYRIRFLKTPQEKQGFIQPYSDSPLDSEATGENIYLNLINRATKQICITTPYLIVDNEMITALCNASKSGVDVKIIVPGIADKKIVNELTKSYYKWLIEAGVQIYEYIPGFIHAKTVIVDNEYATVGTVNFDYRSLYLHFECGVWMYQTPCIQDIKKDFIDTIHNSKQITLGDCKNISIFRRMFRAVLRLFAPMM